MISINKIKSIIKVLLRKEYPFNKEIQIDTKWVGNDYGGFYIASDFLNQDSIVYSFGIGQDISFDTELIGMYNCIVHGFDPTPKSINWIANQELPREFIFHDYGIDLINGKRSFFLPDNENFVSGSVYQLNKLKPNGIKVKMRNLEAICKELKHDRIDVLKMDIEGSEYDIIPSLLESEIQIKQILIEFHHRFFNDGFERTKSILALFKQNNYKVFAISDSFQEISFIRDE